MNQKVLVTLCFSANDAPLAEKLLDHCYKIHGKRQVGHILLVANPDAHQEMRQRIKITAELAFESVTETVAPTLIKEMASNKVRQMNNLFRHAAITVQSKFKWPWLYLEPDCTICQPDWITQFANAYDIQPRRYLGLVSKNASDKMIMARCGVYHPGASHELDKLCQSDAPFAAACAEKIVESATHTPLVAYLPIEEGSDILRIPEKAVICHGDKMGIFAEIYEQGLKEKQWMQEENEKRGASDKFYIGVIHGQAAPPAEEIHRVDEAMVQPPINSARTVANSSGAMVLAPVQEMSPQEIAKEINKFLKEPAVNPERLDVISFEQAAKDSKEREDNELQKPRTTRRAKAEALDKQHRLDCVATNGCKSSTPVTPV